MGMPRNFVLMKYIYSVKVYMFNNYRKIGMTGVFLLLAVLMTCCEEKNTEMVYEMKEPDDLSGEVYEVFSKMITSYYGDQDYVVVQQETDTSLHRNICYDLLASDTTSLTENTLRNYIQNNQESKNLGPSFTTLNQVKLITREELNSYENWGRFHENYPDGEGVLVLRLPGFDQDKTRALFEFSWRSGNESEGDHLVYIEYANGAWHIRAHVTF